MRPATTLAVVLTAAIAAILFLLGWLLDRALSTPEAETISAEAVAVICLCWCVLVGVSAGAVVAAWRSGR